MPIEIPRFDPDLKYHGAIGLSSDGGALCHAVVSRYDDGEFNKQTECGIELADAASEPRCSFIETEHAMCPDCWPLDEIDDNDDPE